MYMLHFLKIVREAPAKSNATGATTPYLEHTYGGVV